MNHSLRYALVGAGAGIAEAHLRALTKLPSARVVGMADLNPERGRPRADAAGCPFFTDHAAMIEATRPDVVVICTPHPSHPRIALDAFARGAYVLTEKPIAIQVADADRMLAAADAAGRVLAVNFQQRFRPVIERAARFIAEGELGELMRVQVSESWYRTAAYYRQAPWRGEGGAILMNQFARDVRKFAACEPSPYATLHTVRDALELPGDGGGHLAVYRDLEAAIAEGGIVDVRRLMDALRAVGYDGWIAFEDFSTELPLAQRIRDNLAYLKRLV